MLATAKSVEGDTSRPSCGQREPVSTEESLGAGPDPTPPHHLDGAQQVLSGVIETRNHFAEALRVRCPQHDDFVQAGASPEIADVPTDLLQLGMGKVRGGCTGSSDLWRPGLLSFPSALDPQDGSVGTKEEQVRGGGGEDKWLGRTSGRG